MPRTGPELQLASYNLLHGIHLAGGPAPDRAPDDVIPIDLDAAGGAIDALGADIVALQEVDRYLDRSGGVDQVAVLAGQLGWHGVFGPALLGNPDAEWRSVTGDDGGPAYGVGWLSRWPIAEAAVVPLPGGGAGTRRAGASMRNPGWDREPRAALTIHIAMAGGTLRATTTHLSYLPHRAVAQLRTALAVAGEGDGPAVLVGDLNLPAWIGRVAARRGWRHGGGQATYPAWRPRLQVDQLLVRGEVAVRDVRVGPAATSDHLPLLATLVLGAP